MGVGVGGFELFLSVGARVFRSLGSFTIRDVVDFGGLLCLTSTLVCSVSLCGSYYGVGFFLKISANFPLACKLLAPMDANGGVGSGM